MSRLTMSIACFGSLCVSATAQEPGRPPFHFEPAAGSPILVGPMAGRPALGDVNGDGRLDVVVACGTCCGDKPDPKSGHLVVLINDLSKDLSQDRSKDPSKGRSAFSFAPDSPRKIGDSVRKVALGDVNGDGKLDVAAAEHDRNEITLLLGDGKGGFAPAPVSSITAGSGPRPHTHDVALVDVNGDRKLDLLATLVNDHRVAVLLGDGRSGFAHSAGSPFLVARGPYDSIVTGDLDGDGDIDLAVPCIHGNAIDVLAGDGKGGFARMPGAPHVVSNRPGYLVGADVDLDFDLDLLSTHDDVGLLTVLVNDGKGGFAKQSDSPRKLPRMSWGIAADDLDGDGYLDLAFGGGGSPASTPVLLVSDASGAFDACASSGLPKSERGEFPLFGDFDGDGRLDLVVNDYARGEITISLAR